MLEYRGTYITQFGCAKSREADMTALGRGSYTFYFHHPVSSRMHCIDSSFERIDFGCARLINHSHRRPNLVPMAVVSIDVSMLRIIFAQFWQYHEVGQKTKQQKPARLVFCANRDIQM